MPITNSSTACYALRQRRCNTRRVIWEVVEQEIDRDPHSNYETLPGTLSVHSVLAINPDDPTVLIWRSLACFCESCLNFQWQNCENLQHCGPWKMQRLQPKHVYRDTDEELELAGVYAADDERLDDTIQVGEVFASFA